MPQTMNCNIGRTTMGRSGVSQWYLDASADISDDGMYRYWLSRRLSMGERTVLFVGLNPSTADATKDDPTIRRCVGFARAWGFDGSVSVWLSAAGSRLGF